MDNKLTVLEEIIKEIGEELYQKWYNALAIEDRTEEASKAMSVNAGETAVWVIQTFMNKFNNAAEELKGDYEIHTAKINNPLEGGATIKKLLPLWNWYVLKFKTEAMMELVNPQAIICSSDAPDLYAS